MSRSTVSLTSAAGITARTTPGLSPAAGVPALGPGASPRSRETPGSGSPAPTSLRLRRSPATSVPVVRTSPVDQIRTTGTAGKVGLGSGSIRMSRSPSWLGDKHIYQGNPPGGATALLGGFFAFRGYGW